MSEAELAKLRGKRNVFLRHMKSIEQEINGFQDEVLGEREAVKLKSLRNNLEKRMFEVKGLDDLILNEMSVEESENELANILVRDDKFGFVLMQADSSLSKLSLVSSTVSVPEETSSISRVVNKVK